MAVVQLNQEKHLNTRVRNDKRARQFVSAHILPIVIHELHHVSTESPVVYVKNAETGQFQLVGVYGIAPGENLAVSDERWRFAYVPAVVRNLPFKLIQGTGPADQLSVGIDDDSPLIDERQGERLFAADGAESDYLTRRKESLARYVESEQVTAGLTEFLAEHELLSAGKMTIDAGGETIDLQGIYSIDESALNKLDDEAFLELRRRGFLGPIYLQMASLNQFRHLAGLRAERGNPPQAGAA